MPLNVMLHGACNLECPYCFAEPAMDEARERGGMPLARAQALLDWLEKSGHRQFSVLGGEPTLHREFEPIVQAALDRGFHIKVLTNGVIPEKRLAYLAGLPPERLTVLINANRREDVKPSQWEAMRKSFEALSRSAALSFNIDSPDTEFDFLVDLVVEFGLMRTVRLGLALPVLGGSNRYLPIERYPDVSGRIVSFVERADAHNIRVYGDCGFILCMFSDEQLGKLQRANADFKPKCEPILDIGPDLTAWHCFPLSKFKVPLARFEKADELNTFFEGRVKPFKHIGSMDICQPCRYRERGQCYGGCLAFSIDKLKLAPELLEKHFQKPAGEP